MTARGYASARGRPRVPPEERARREAYALDLLRAGTPRLETAAMARLDGAVVRALAEANGIESKAGKNQNRALSATELARREAHCLELIRSGMVRQDAGRLAGLRPSLVARLCERHGVPRRPPGRPALPMPTVKAITAMSHAELDALEAEIARAREAGATPRPGQRGRPAPSGGTEGDGQGPAAPAQAERG